MNAYLQKLLPDEEANFSIWKATRKTRKPPIRTTDGTWARENKQKADLFAAHLVETFTPYQCQMERTLVDYNNQKSENITPITPKEVTEEIKTNLNSRKAPGFDLITGEIIKHLPRKGIVLLTYLFNAVIRLKHVPACWKVAEIIMIPKPNKQPNDVSSYRPISLLPIVSKIFEKLLLKRMRPLLESNSLIPKYQFGFREKHSTIDQVHRLTDIIEQALEEKQICTGVFLDVAQAFDKVWHEGLLHKLNKMLPRQYVEILSSYMSDRLFRIKVENEYSDLKDIKAGVPQGSVLGSILYLLFTNDIPDMEGATIATFADALLTVDKDPDTAVLKLQQATDRFVNWTKRWRIELNENKSVVINFTNRKLANPPTININGKILSYENKAKYLGLTLDAKLKWKEHVKTKLNELRIKYRQLYWLLGRGSNLSINNKVLVYNQVLKPVWLYGIQLWGCTKPSNIKMIQTFQNKVLRNIVRAPWYVRNDDLHRDLCIPLIRDEIKTYAQKHERRLHQHVNTEAIQLLDTTHHANRRLKRIKPFELVSVLA